MLPIRFSHLKACGRSPAHALHAMSGEDVEETYAMERGTAVHALLFGTREVTFAPMKRDERTAAWREFRDAHKDAEILTEAEFRKATAMATAVRKNELAMRLLKGPKVINEHTLLFDLAGRNCRATPDARGPEGIVELKCTNNASPMQFYWHSRRMCWAEQLSWYSTACDVLEIPVGPGRWIVAVEDKAPHVVAVYEIMPRLALRTDKTVRLWWEQLRACEQSDAFPGYSEVAIPLEDPEALVDGLVWGDEDDETQEAAA